MRAHSGLPRFSWWNSWLGVLCFFKNTPTASQNLSRRRETFLIELLGFERVSSYAPLSWPTYATLSTHCFGRESQMVEPGCYLSHPAFRGWGNWGSERPRRRATFWVRLRASARPRSLDFRPVILPPSSEVTSGQPVATSTPQMCFLWPESVLICISCQHLEIRRFHIKTHISGCS